MMISRDFTGKTEDDAIRTALAELELDRDDVSIEIIERAKSGFLGIGASPAVIRVEYELPPEPEPEPEPSALEDRIREFISGLIEHMGIDAEIEVSEKQSGSDGFMVNLRGNGLGAVIGRRGETLNAVQHLTNYAMNRGSADRVFISVDAENYRQKREQGIERLAEKMAEKVVKYRRSMAMDPMNSYERRIVHSILQNYPNVTTSSTGTEPNRKVVVSYSGER